MFRYMLRKYLNLTVKIPSEIAVCFKVWKGMDSEALCQNAFNVFFHLRQGRGVWNANYQPLISNMVHHLAVGCIVVCQRVDAPTMELLLVLVATVLTDEPLSQSTLQNIDTISSQLKAFTPKWIIKEENHSKISCYVYDTYSIFSEILRL